MDAQPTVSELKRFGENPLRSRRLCCGSTAPAEAWFPRKKFMTPSSGFGRSTARLVIASMGTVAASGGYYIAAATDRIIANPGTLTGSIGVIMELANVEGLMKKIGVEGVVVKSGRV